MISSARRAARKIRNYCVRHVTARREGVRQWVGCGGGARADQWAGSGAERVPAEADPRDRQTSQVAR